MVGRETIARPIARSRDVALAGAAAMFALALIAVPALAEDDPPLNAVSSTGGVATAEGSSSVQTGDIVTGLNTGHTVETGGTTNGDINVNVDAMSSAADLAVIAEIGPQIADASGGDGGEAATSPGDDPPEYNINIDNTDNNRNDNRSDATGIGEGGQGGQGGSGGNVIVGEE
jgi:hypothetical protein